MTTLITLHKSNKPTEPRIPYQSHLRTQVKKEEEKYRIYAFEKLWDSCSDLSLSNHPKYEMLYKLVLE